MPCNRLGACAPQEFGSRRLWRSVAVWWAARGVAVAARSAYPRLRESPCALTILLFCSSLVVVPLTAREPAALPLRDGTQPDDCFLYAGAPKPRSHAAREKCYASCGLARRQVGERAAGWAARSWKPQASLGNVKADKRRRWATTGPIPKKEAGPSPERHHQSSRAAGGGLCGARTANVSDCRRIFCCCQRAANRRAAKFGRSVRSWCSWVCGVDCVKGVCTGCVCTGCVCTGCVCKAPQRQRRITPSARGPGRWLGSGIAVSGGCHLRVGHASWAGRLAVARRGASDLEWRASLGSCRVCRQTRHGHVNGSNAVASSQYVWGKGSGQGSTVSARGRLPHFVDD